MTVGELLSDPARILAVVYALATAVVVLFQLGVAAGKAWGEYTMGGRYSGRLPAVMRVAALVQAAVLAVLAAVVLDAAGVVGLGWTDKAWLPFVPVVVAALSLVLNASSRSEPERRTWTPVAIVLLVSSLAVAILTR
jgi:cytochrome bd-type quinol oxidase subunit 2